MTYRVIVAAMCLCLLTACPQKPPPPQADIEKVSPGALPAFGDDLDRESLRGAIEKSLTFYSRVPADRSYPLGSRQVRADQLKASLLAFLELLDTGRLNAQTIAESFDVFRARSGDASGQALITGYFEPILEGRLEPDATFCYPLYGLPSDLLSIDLSTFNPERFAGQRLVGRIEGNRVVPYYTRAEIDDQKRLERTAPALVWLKDALDAFFLHVQGSGLIEVPGKGGLRVGYAGSNGRPYRSIGGYLIQKGLLSREEMSLQAIRSYLRAHPEIQREVLNTNESYVFFRWVKEGPVGSINVTLTAGRSIATDPQFHPQGALAFLETQKPRLDSNGQILGWEPLQRWVLNQDTGGAIKGIGRADLFCGSGETAEWTAGRLKHPGSLYILIKKGEVN